MSRPFHRVLYLLSTWTWSRFYLFTLYIHGGLHPIAIDEGPACIDEKKVSQSRIDLERR